MSDLAFLAGAEPLFLPGGATGCLLLHGFTGTPEDMRPLAEALSGEGHTVMVPRLAHHGTDPADMNRSRWQDWYYSALDGWHLLSPHCPRIFVIGHSMGGALGLLLAAREAVAGIVTVNTPLFLYPDWRLRWARPIGRLRPYIPKEDWDSQLERGRVAYSVSPTRAIAELRDLLELMERALLAVNAPALLIHDREDDTAPPESLEHIYRRLGSAQKELMWLDSGWHNFMLGPDRQRIVQRITQFVGGVLNASA